MKVVNKIVSVLSVSVVLFGIVFGLSQITFPKETESRAVKSIKAKIKADRIMFDARVKEIQRQ